MKNKNIHVLPTDKPSRLYKEDNVYKLDNLVYRTGNQNIYITNDEEIKEDYVFAYGVVIKVMMFDVETLYFVNGTKAKREDCKKIILTDDQDLIKDGVQAIDDEFLEWFVKNPSCEYVETKRIIKEYVDDQDAYGYDVNYYKIIIPKEESKQDRTCSKNCSVVCGECQIFEPKQETLEEVIGMKSHEYSMQYVDTDKYTVSMLAIQFGYQLAQQQNKNLYSEEEVRVLINRLLEFISHHDIEEWVEWIEKQFKKK